MPTPTVLSTRLRRAGLVADGEARLASNVAETLEMATDEASTDLIVMSA